MSDYWTTCTLLDAGRSRGHLSHAPAGLMMSRSDPNCDVVSERRTGALVHRYLCAPYYVHVSMCT